MTAMTCVVNLATGEESHWSLAPDKAVVAAWEHSQGNRNIWTYREPRDHPEFVQNPRTVSCGRTTIDTFSAVRGQIGDTIHRRPETVRQRVSIRQILADPVTRRELLINACRFIIATEGRDLSRAELEALVDSTEPAHLSARNACHGSDPGGSATLSGV